MSGADGDGIKNRPKPRCILCGSGGAPLYTDLKDRLFGASGSWDMRRCTDPGCGLIWLDPEPVREDIHKAYKNYYTHYDYGQARRGRARLLMRDILALPARFPFSPQAVSERAIAAYLGARHGYDAPPADRYLGRLLALHPGRRADIDFDVAYLRASPGKRLLDVGCGSGRFIKGMTGRGWSARGIDIDGSAVADACKAGLDALQGELLEARFPAGHFDAVTLSHVIEHVHDPAAVLKECRRILSRDGRLVVVTPNTLSWGHRLYGKCYMHLDPPRHLNLFNVRSLRAMTENAGFSVESVFTTVRGANELFLGCRDIESTGRHQMGGFQPLAARAWARAMQIAELARMRSEPGSGEEIALVGG